MGLLKKKKNSKVAQHDAASIDEAMSELSKQTEALLGNFGESPKTPKPELPKKNAQPVTARKSFDIIHDPSRKTRLNSTLKSRPAAQESIVIKDTPEAEESQEPELDALIKAETAEQESASGAVVIKGHRARLTISADQDPELNEEDPITSAEESSESKDEVKAAVASVPVSHEALSFDKNPEGDASDMQQKPEESEELEEPEQTEESEKPEAVEVEVVEAVDPQEVSDKSADNGSVENSTKQTDSKESNVSTELAVDDSYTSGELYASNLVKDVKPKGYQALNEGATPAVFDTEEYHPELHDWSKLERKNGSRWVLLTLLIIVACGLGYFVLSGQQLPF